MMTQKCTQTLNFKSVVAKLQPERKIGITKKSDHFMAIRFPYLQRYLKEMKKGTITNIPTAEQRKYLK